MPDAVLGIDIGGTQIKAGLVNAAGAIERQARVDTPLNLAALRDVLCELLQGLAADRMLRGVGVGCKGVIDPSTTRIDCQPGVMQYLEGCVLLELVREALGDANVPVYADNDARVALAGECVWGAARGRSDAILLTLGTGVGGAILSGGRMLRGHGGIAGHLGHLTTDPNGSLCICGNRGCLETVFSARVMEAQAFAAGHRGLVTSLAPDASCAGVFAAAREGDAVAREIVREGVFKLGGAIAGLLHALDPEIVILGGQVSRAGDTLFAPLAAEIRWRTRTLLRREVPLVTTHMEDPSGIVGAAALVFSAG